MPAHHDASAVSPLDMSPPAVSHPIGPLLPHHMLLNETYDLKMNVRIACHLPPALYQYTRWQHHRAWHSPGRRVHLSAGRGPRCLDNCHRVDALLRVPDHDLQRSRQAPEQADQDVLLVRGDAQNGSAVRLTGRAAAAACICRPPPLVGRDVWRGQEGRKGGDRTRWNSRRRVTPRPVSAVIFG